jgi:hypothetical protein
MAARIGDRRAGVDSNQNLRGAETRNPHRQNSSGKAGRLTDRRPTGFDDAKRSLQVEAVVVARDRRQNFGFGLDTATF